MPTRTRPQRRRTRSRAGVSNLQPTRLQQQDATARISPQANIQQRPKAAEPDYSYVFRDLKHTAIIVGGIMAIYIILRFTLLK